MKNLSLLFLMLLGCFGLRASESNPFFQDKDLITVGIYYYPEHWDSSQWERDIANIAEMGFEFVHLAEFAWFKMEPEEGKFDFEWLDRVIALCEKYHLKVILCTPSATTPTWMRLKYPETFLMNGNYIRAENGTRGLESIVNPLFRKFVERVVAEMGVRYGKHPAVVGWQIDNEPGAQTDYSPSSQEAFREWLKNKYQTIDQLNAQWGTAFWSQWFRDFEEVIIPNTSLVTWWGNNPHALMDFKRYSADAQAGFLDLQAEVLRRYISDNQYITTNYTGVSQGSDPRRTQKLDFATYTVYPNGGSRNLGPDGFRIGNHQSILFAAEYYKSIGGVTGIMELQPGPVNWGSINPLLLPGTVRMWLYHTFAAGGKLACSYRYRQLLYSAEQYHSGIVQTDGVTLSPGGEDYKQFIKEVRALRSLYKSGASMPEKISARKAAILWNHENIWSINRQRQTSQWDAWGFPGKYLEILKSFGAPVDIISEHENLSDYPFVMVPAYELVDSTLVQKWTNYALQGGHLVITCRTAIKNRNGHFWEDKTAAPILDLIGANIQASDMLLPDGRGELKYQDKIYLWNNWGDLLVPDSNTLTLAIFNNQFYAGTPAVVQRKLGKGTVTYIGVSTDDSLLETDVLRSLYSMAGVATESFPEGVYMYWRDGFYFIVNYSSEPYQALLPDNAKIIIGEPSVCPAGVLVWSES